MRSYSGSPERGPRPIRQHLPLLAVVVFGCSLLALLICGLLAVSWSLYGRAGVRSGLTPAAVVPTVAPSPVPTSIPERLIPTPTALLLASPSPVPTASPIPTSNPAPSIGAVERHRIGVVAPRSDLDRYPVETLGAAWYLTGLAERTSPPPAGMEFVPLVQVLGGTFSPGPERLAELAHAQPGALWLVGNEPDVIWQDNATPEEYARVYHDVYTALKEADPTCQVAVGAIAQVTPLRLRYLDTILAAYQAAYDEPMPVDVWNVHLALLREERGVWGVDIPPGLAEDQGLLLEVEDNADVARLQEQVMTFRRWMAERGWRDRPLVVSEFSVLMPPDYGFPFETVRDFMRAAFDYMLTAVDGQVGYPADGNRLVQRCAWYSVADDVYSTGNLFDPATGRITPLGRALSDYIAGR